MFLRLYPYSFFLYFFSQLYIYIYIIFRGSITFLNDLTANVLAFILNVFGVVALANASTVRLDGFGIWVRDLIQEKNEGEHAMIEVHPERYIDKHKFGYRRVK